MSILIFRKGVEGLSVRSVFFNVFQNLIVVLYVFDNDTNMVIRMSCFVGLGIEIWKVTKVQDVSFDFENKLFGLFPRIQLEDKKDYEDSGTKEFDRMAFKYLGMLCFPLAFCYCIYSVIYNEHKVTTTILTKKTKRHYILASGLVQLHPWLNVRFSSDLRLHHDDSATVHQLQAEVGGPHAVEDDDLQGSQHVHR